MEKIKFNQILIIASIIVIAILLNKNYYSSGNNVKVLNKSGNIVINLYDKSGNIISFPERFSIVNYEGTGNRDVPNVDSLDFTVIIDNVGGKDLDCYIMSASPPQLSTALGVPTSNVILYPNHMYAWTSSIISIAQFEDEITKTRFQVDVKCTYDTGEIIQSNWVDLLIKRDRDDIVIFRTNVVQHRDGTTPYTPALAYQDSSLTGEGETSDGGLKWVAFDKDGDNIMEAYGPTSSTTTRSILCEDASDGVLFRMTFGHPLCPSGNRFYCDIWIMDNPDPTKIGLAYQKQTGTPDSCNIRWYSTSGTGASNAVTTSTPLEPFASNFQERYIQI